MRSDKHKGTIFTGINSFFKKSLSSIRSLSTQKFTVMFIPHSEKKVVNFQMSTLLMGFLSLLLLGVVVAFFYMTTMFSSSEQQLSEQQDDLVVTQGNLDSILEEVNQLIKAYDIFDNTMNDTVSQLNLSTGDDNTITRQGDLSSISNLQEISTGEVREIYELRRLRDSLTEAIQPLDNISSVLRNEKQILADIPTLWPVASGRSLVTMEFGPNIHPIHGTWYLHKGIDIAGPVGLPIVAAANGKVIESREDKVSGYGHFILIEHKYGFRTRYSHLDTRLVEAGDVVAQGQRIGTLGQTGLATGPHLDFQVMLGTEVLDPASFLKIKNSFARWDGDTY